MTAAAERRGGDAGRQTAPTVGAGLAGPSAQRVAGVVGTGGQWGATWNGPRGATRLAPDPTDVADGTSEPR